MLGSNRKRSYLSRFARNSIALIATALLAVTIVAAQDLPSVVPRAGEGTSPIGAPGLNGLPSPSGAVATAGGSGEANNGAVTGFASIGDSAEGQSIRSGRPRQVTLEQVKQQSANRVAAPLAYLNQLSIEAAKQHRLGVQADYFPKFGATFLNVHTTDFLGEIVQIRHPLTGGLTQVPIAIFNQNQTMAVLTFVQPITPLFAVREAVRIARADERIAKAKAAASVSKAALDKDVEETYFKLLIAQRRLISGEWKLRSAGSRILYASTSVDLASVSAEEPAAMEARKAVETAASTVKELTAYLNRIMGWPADTELELAAPDPLVENISLQDVSDKSTAANAALVEAEETVVKARAAASISKMAYVPVVAAVAGYMFQNTLPAVSSNFGYGGVMASYTLFDFGKREHAVKEARAQVGMAETALQLTKAKLAADVTKSYFELERSRQLNRVAQKMGASAVLLMKVSSAPQSLEVRAARADVELEMLEADLAHRQAFNKLQALLGPDRQR
ncbi:MAG: TolC family protein [Bryobacteraceae bacterium]